MRFEIRIINANSDERLVGKIKIDDFEESFDMSDQMWSPQRYERQWKDALSALVNFTVNRCVLITYIVESDGECAAFFWKLYREDQVVYIYEQFVQKDAEALAGNPLRAEPHIRARVERSEDGDELSQWETSVEDVAAFVQSIS